MATKDRIIQGTSVGDKLYTVRPRYAKELIETRGSPCSIKFNLPDPVKKNYQKYRSGVDANVYRAFSEAVEGVNSDQLGYVNFLAQNIAYNLDEKHQIVHTFGGGEAVYYFGRSPIRVTISGLVTDDLDNDQFTSLMGLYLKFIRGTQASKEYSFVTLSTPNAQFEGSFSNISVNQDSSRAADVNFTATFIAKTYVLLSTDKSPFGKGDDIKFTATTRQEDPTLTRKDIKQILDNISNTSLSGTQQGFFDKDRFAFTTLPKLNSSFLEVPGIIDNFFGKLSVTLTDIAAIITNPVNQISDYAKFAVNVVESVESGIDTLGSSLNSVTRQVYGAIDQVTDAYGKIVNFPASVSNKLGGLLGPGGSALPVTGSTNISSAASSGLLAAGAEVGATRGTPEGSGAVLIVVSNSDGDASLLADSGSEVTEEDIEEAPSLIVDDQQIRSYRIGG